VNQAPRRLDATEFGDSRIDEILMLARDAFVEKGFDGASMQDLARAAGMSAGNFYRYFSSKAAIVDAMVARDLDEIDREFAQISAAENPIDSLRSLLWSRISGIDCEKDYSLWSDIMAAANRKPEVAQVLARMEAQVCTRLTQLFALLSGTDEATAYQRYMAHARLVFLMVRGVALENINRKTTDSDLAALIMRTIDGLVDEIAQGKTGDTR
jgi:AcrR family transcriptional regulator